MFKNEEEEEDDFKKPATVVVTSPFQQKMTKFCHLLSRTGQNAELFDLFCVEHLKKHDDLVRNNFISGLGIAPGLIQCVDFL